MQQRRSLDHGAAVAALTALVSPSARADSDVPEDTDQLQSIEVTGTAVQLGLDIPRSIDTIDKKALSEQHLTLVQDALRNVPGITLNSGEGGAHGDSVNLRGLSIPDSFFLDGVRDIGQYRRDTFNSEAISVLLGPASAMFGRGSTSGVINSISKQPTLTPLALVSASAGQGDLLRETGDFNLPWGPTAAARITLMNQRNGVVDRDQVFNQSYGIAPTLSFGLGTPTRLSLSYFKEEENDIPDYGIPFIDGAPAAVARNNYYGLANYDRTRTNTNIGTLRVEHDFADEYTVSDSLRYANYGFQYLLSGPFLGNDTVDAPPPGTPYADIRVSRDQPSSAGTTALLINRVDLTAKFEIAGVAQALTGGLELSKEWSNVNRFQNGLNDIPPTPLLDPDPYYSPPTPLLSYSNPKAKANDVSPYVLDSMAVGTQWDVDLELRWDRFKSRYSEAFSATGFARTDSFVSPRVAVVFKPDPTASVYLSYGTSYNPVIEYLIIAPTDQGLKPEKNSTVELGAKFNFLKGAATLTGALFDTQVKNVRNSDPDDPTVQDAPFDQRVKGLELSIDGHLTDSWEIAAGYTHLDDEITTSSDPNALGKRAPNAPHDAFNVWSSVRLNAAWEVGGGVTAVSQRYADADNTAGVPAYAVFNAMTSYQFNEHVKLQLNLNNVADTLYYSGFYYVGIQENHAVPSPGRTLIGSITYRF
jgi:catecholate siderophore receptor